MTTAALFVLVGIMLWFMSWPNRLSICASGEPVGVLCRSSVRFLDVLKRLGGNEKRLGCPLLKLAPDRNIQTKSYIRLLMLLKLGNVIPSEPISLVE
jgi:hypothetical protein